MKVQRYRAMASSAQLMMNVDGISVAAIIISCKNFKLGRKYWTTSTNCWPRPYVSIGWAAQYHDRDLLPEKIGTPAYRNIEPGKL
jgi:hypothetical protein